MESETKCSIRFQFISISFYSDFVCHVFFYTRAAPQVCKGFVLWSFESSKKAALLTSRWFFFFLFTHLEFSQQLLEPKVLNLYLLLLLFKKNPFNPATNSALSPALLSVCSCISKCVCVCARELVWMRDPCDFICRYSYCEMWELRPIY